MMSTKLAYLPIALALLLFSACGSDDDDSNTDGIGGDPNSLRITLEWTQADADLDLDLEDGPAAAYATGIHSGDILSGPGRETITWVDNAPDGTYEVAVYWADGQGSVNYKLTIQSAETGRTIENTVSGTEDDYISFSKSGTNLQF
jgi:hypothetical protein